jgi:tripartite-type tricarboxylate transporter receptor subunit TctC
MKKLVLALAFFPLLALAQQYPTKPIRMIVPFPAGGPADIFGRGLAQGMTEQLGQTVIIENVGGVGGVLGVDRALKSAPDGYTLGFNSGSTLSIAPFSFAKLPYDVKRDVGLITLVVRVPEVLAVHPSLPVNSLAELIEHARKNPGKVNFGSAGGGSITHLAGELLKSEAKVDLVHVPYKGAAPAVNDLLGGQVQMGIFDVPVLLGHIRSGKLKALAVTSATRAPTLPDVPTTAEVRPGRARGHARGHPEAHPCGRGRCPEVAERHRAIRQGRRARLARLAAGLCRLPRYRAGEVEQGRVRHRLQGKQLIALQSIESAAKRCCDSCSARCSTLFCSCRAATPSPAAAAVSIAAATSPAIAGFRPGTIRPLA